VVTDWGFSTSEPSGARIYDLLLGGKDNFLIDHEAAHRLIAAFPAARIEARENRSFILRAVQYLAEAGVRQFLDIGAGFQDNRNVHQVLDAVLLRDGGETGRVLYVDNDPIAVVHGRALLTGAERVATCVLDGDLRKPDEILHSPELASTLDLSRPVGLLLGAVLPHCDDDAVAAVQRLIRALPSGSYVALSHVTADFLAPQEQAQAAALRPCVPFQLRTRDEIAEFLAGLTMVEPGWVTTSHWRPELEPYPGRSGWSENPLCYGVVAHVCTGTAR
jgi:hypothetical protein